MVARLASTLEESDSALLDELVARFDMKRSEYIRWSVLFAMREHSGKPIKIPEKFVVGMRTYMDKVWEQVEQRAEEPAGAGPAEAGPAGEAGEATEVAETGPMFPPDLWKTLVVGPSGDQYRPAEGEAEWTKFPEPRGPPAEYLPLDEYMPKSAHEQDMILYIRTYFTSLTQEEQDRLWQRMELFVHDDYYRALMWKFLDFVANMLFYRMYVEFPHNCPSCGQMSRETYWTDWVWDDHHTYLPKINGTYHCGPCVIHKGRWKR